MKAKFIPPPVGQKEQPFPIMLQLELTDVGGFVHTKRDSRLTFWASREDFEALREILPRPAIEKDILDGAVKALIAKQIEQRIEAQLIATEVQQTGMDLRVKANNLARLVEQTAYVPVEQHFAQYGNDAPAKLLRAAVADVDAALKKAGLK